MHQSFDSNDWWVILTNTLEIFVKSLDGASAIRLCHTKNMKFYGNQLLHHRNTRIFTAFCMPVFYMQTCIILIEKYLLHQDQIKMLELCCFLLSQTKTFFFFLELQSCHLRRRTVCIDWTSHKKPLVFWPLFLNQHHEKRSWWHK